jgi:hypothetical protein
MATAERGLDVERLHRFFVRGWPCKSSGVVPGKQTFIKPQADPAPRKHLSYTAIYNFVGMPAGVVAATRVAHGDEGDRPRGFDLVERAARQVEQGSERLPVGVQVVARPWRDDIAIHFMSVLEEYFRR